MSDTKTFYSNGKLLLTGEYAVLDGAKALAVPTRFGQTLSITKNNSKTMSWQSKLPNGEVWFSTDFNFDGKMLRPVSTSEKANRLEAVLNISKKLNPQFLEDFNGLAVETQLDFEKDWGLGSSSTLINNVANWAGVDAYTLLEKTFGGSGYDIACTQHDTPIFYQLNGTTRTVEEVPFNPNFKDQLFFVHLNTKRNSRDAISKYRSTSREQLKASKDRISELTEALVKTANFSDFEMLLNQHETIISKLIKEPTIKDQLFSDYAHAVKSLGAWGGDFVLVVGDKNDQNYFKNKGYHTILSYDAMVLA